MLPLRPRALRSLRQIIRQLRNTSTSTTPTKPTPITTTIAASTPGPQKPPHILSRYRRALLWTTLGLTLGLTAGSFVSHTIAPPPHPLPGSHEDAILLQDLNLRLDSNFKVKVLRGKCTAVAASLRGDEGTWTELDTSLLPGLTGDAMAGARGLGVQRVFWNGKEGELVAVVWFGGGVSGWPGVTHGGAIATVLSEKMVTAAGLCGGMQEGELQRLELQYKKPTYANAFYVLRCKAGEGVELGNAVEIEGQLETLEGDVCVKATGTVEVREGKGVGQVLESLTPRKSWLGWRSRSDE